MTRLIALGLMMAIIVFGLAQAEEGQRKSITRDYQALVKGLVSTNRPADCADAEAPPRFPHSYDRHAQGRIENNRRILYEHCEEALPLLMEAVSDNRYSLTYQSDSYTGNLSVGGVCLEIVSAYLEVYRPYIDSGSKESLLAHTFFRQFKSSKEIEDWWQGRKDKSLVGLQIEALEWAIAKRQEEVRPGKDQPSDASIERLIVLRDNLTRNRHRLPPEHIRPSAGCEKRTLIAKLNPREAKAADEILELTGRVTIDENSQSVIGVDFSGWEATDARLRRLKTLTRLETLNLSASRITDAGLKHLTGLAELQTLRLEETKVTTEGLKQLQQALPDCKIYWKPPTSDTR